VVLLTGCSPTGPGIHGFGLSRDHSRNHWVTGSPYSIDFYWRVVDPLRAVNRAMGFWAARRSDPRYGLLAFRPQLEPLQSGSGSALRCTLASGLLYTNERLRRVSFGWAKLKGQRAFYRHV